MKKQIIRRVSQRRFIRYGLLSVNVALLGAIVVFVAQSSPTVTSSHSSVTDKGATVNGVSDPLDQLSSADIAVNLAQMTALPETTAVTNQADSVGAELAVPVAHATVISKPQAVQTDLKSNKDIVSYIAQAGDTIAAIAAKFNVTSDSIRWSNGLTGDAISSGTKVNIPPVNGIVYTVKPGDTPDSLATKYKASKEQIVAYNDAELSGLPVGGLIIIPNGQEPTPVSTRGGSGSYGFFFGGGGYNGYDRGFCTWYVANKRASIGRPIPGGLGNANTWDDRAPSAGFTVNKIPAYGAAVVTKQSRPGHVAFVERVNDDGSIWISEMNSSGQRGIDDPRPARGWGVVDFKLISASAASSYSYIH
ncbi:MAG TPA: CHAP domain-containing protein [Candidatus Saccharimonadales bacterium]|nr:CHAP domain-containing protein [Candidatus Saccharimonadales bacterium]